MKKVKTYEPSMDYQKPQMILTGASEIVCNIRNSHINHWIYKGIPQNSFTVESTNTWDPH